MHGGKLGRLFPLNRKALEKGGATMTNCSQRGDGAEEHERKETREKWGRGEGSGKSTTAGKNC